MKTRPESRPVCGYCHQRWRHPQTTSIWEIPPFAQTEMTFPPVTQSFFACKRRRTRVLRILFLGRGVCDDAICAERVANATRLSTFSAVSSEILIQVAQAIGEVRRRAIQKGGGDCKRNFRPSPTLKVAGSCRPPDDAIPLPLDLKQNHFCAQAASAAFFC